MALFIVDRVGTGFTVRPGDNALQAAASALKAQSWAEGTLPGGAGTKSAKEWAGDSAASAATAEAASGPTYASTAAGLAATTNGQAFAVDAGGGLVSVYLNSAGTAVLQRTLATTAYLASSAGAGAVGLVQGGTVADAIRYVTPEMFGAVGDGVTDDTLSVQTALNTALDVYISDGSIYKVTVSPVVNSTNNRQIFGSGKILQGANNVNCIDASGAQNLTITGIELEGYAATAAGTDFTKNNGVYASGGRNVVVECCTIHGFSSNGVQLRNVFYPRIEGNLFYDNYYDNASGSDILFYSGIDSAGAVVRSNRCHSNNSQAIYINALGGDRDFIIESNICHTLNADTWGEITDYSAAAGTYRNSAVYLQRRHGIVFGYTAGGVITGRALICGNNIRSTQWTGIYRALNTLDPGTAIVSQNIISNVSMQNAVTGSIEGGILLISCGAGDVFDSNIISDVGNGNQNKAGIKFTPGGTFAGSARFTKNTIKTAAMGIWVSGNLQERTVIAENDMYNFHQRGGIYYAPSGASASINSYTSIRDNLIDGFNGSAWPSAGIAIDLVGALSIPQIIEVDGGTIRARADTTIYGVAFRNLKTTDTLAIGGGIAIDGLENAIWNETYAVGRFPGLRLGRVMVRNSRSRAVCEAFNMGYNPGVNGSAFAVVEAGGGVYQGVSKVIDFRGGAQALYQGKWLDNDRAEVVHTGIPTTGCWVRGDRVIYSGPAAAGAPGAVCVTSGQFGALSGITADTTSGSATITLSAATGLAIGMTVTIAGVTGSKRIIALSGTSATVDTNCDATVTGGAVAYVTPVFKTMAAIAA